MAGTASSAAKKGMGILFNATKSGLSALTTGISKARKGYADKHENDILQELRKRGLDPKEYIFQAFRRFYFLYMAGYMHELAAAAQSSGNRLVDAEKSSVPLDAVIILAHAVSEESLNYGDFAKGKFTQGMQELLNTSRMGEDHFDRKSICHDVYYSVLLATETYGSEWQEIERCFREAASRVIANAINTLDDNGDARTSAAKSLYMFALEIKKLAQDAESKRQKALRDAENLLRKEQENKQRSSLA